MPGLQEQEQDLASAHSLCDEASISGDGVDEYSCSDVHEAIGSDGPVEDLFIGR